MRGEEPSYVSIIVLFIFDLLYYEDGRSHISVSTIALSYIFSSMRMGTSLLKNWKGFFPAHSLLGAGTNSPNDDNNDYPSLLDAGA